MYLAKWPPEVRQLKRHALHGVNPLLAVLSPVAALIAEKKKALYGLGDGSTAPQAAAGALGATPNRAELASIIGAGALITAIAGVAIGIPAYHGYKRNKKSVGWGVWWGFMGLLFPVPTISVAAIQGYGQPLKQVGRRR